MSSTPGSGGGGRGVMQVLSERPAHTNVHDIVCVSVVAKPVIEQGSLSVGKHHNIGL